MKPTAFIVQVFLAGAASYLLSSVLTPLVRRMALAVGCVAHPAQDRWGRRVVPRLGGLSISIGFLAAVAWGSFREPRLLGLFLAGLWISGVGLVDDFRGLHPNTKLIAQIIAGCGVVLSGIQVDLAIMWLAIPLTIGWLVLVMNAFNLMDNMDGLSAGIGVIAASFCVWHALEAQQGVLAILLAALAGATFGFLQYNLPPAKIFMGDTGSQVLGLGLGSLALLGAWKNSTNLLSILAFPTLLLAVPIFDTLFVTVERIFHGRHPFQGGTDHASHRLSLLGLTTRQAVFTLYGVSAAFGAISIGLTSQGQLMVTGVWLSAVGLLLLGGAYLARVSVYANQPEVSENPDVPLIKTGLMHKRRILEVLVDFTLVCASYVFAHLLRFEANLTPDLEKLIFQSLPWIIVIKMACFFACGLYRGLWRYLGIPDLINIFKAVALSSVLSALLVLYLWRFEGYSRAVFIIDGLLLFIAIGGARLTEPLLNEWVFNSLEGSKPVLIVGAGDGGELLLQQIKLDRAGNRRVVGFLDDSPSMQGVCINGIPILGTRRDLGRIVQTHRVQEVFIAVSRPPSDLLQQIQSFCGENNIGWSVTGIPGSSPSTTSTGV
ncbi:MAG: hypothetical protein HYS41_01270 [Candidatus Omnitrophica bacterium]|nr:hypothetical protein [Candidatus Omnitrophota bacterium]